MPDPHRQLDPFESARQEGEQTAAGRVRTQARLDRILLRLELALAAEEDDRPLPSGYRANHRFLADGGEVAEGPT
jgi:hypothetical protein